MSLIVEISGGDVVIFEECGGDVVEFVANSTIVIPEDDGSGGAVSSVNNKTGNVVLNAADIDADAVGAAQAVHDVLQPQVTSNTDALAMLTALLSALQASKADLTYVNDQIANLVGTDAQTLATIQAITDALAESEDLLEALDQTVANRVRFDVATQGLTALQKYNARTNIDAEEVGTAALLISQITAASIGAATSAQLALKQDKLPTTGTAGQFLAHDLTFKTPTGDSGDTITWTPLTKFPLEYEINFSDYDPPMIGRSSTGLIYIKGTVIKPTSSNSSSFALAIIPQSFRTKQLAQLTANNSSIRYVANVSVSVPAFLPWSVSMGRYDANTTIVTILGSLIGISGTSFTIPPTCLGMGV